MAATAQTLVLGAYALNYDSLSDRNLLLCLTGYYAGLTGLTAQQALDGAIGQKYPALDDKQLTECLLDVLS